MITYKVKIKGNEYLVTYVRFRDEDARHSNRRTVTLVTSLTYAEVVELFDKPGEWSVTYQYAPKTDEDGNIIYQEPDIVTDCTDYEKLLSIKDTRTGVLEVVLSEITDGEALAELLEVLNG